ncbi:MAG: hypothetical protein ACRCYU_14555 [Nocardioides sp.]
MNVAYASKTSILICDADATDWSPLREVAAIPFTYVADLDRLGNALCCDEEEHENACYKFAWGNALEAAGWDFRGDWEFDGVDGLMIEVTR